MEKQRNKSISKSCRRLLGFIAVSSIFVTSLFSQSITYNEINKLRVEPAENQTLYTKTDLKFEVSIPKVKPSQIQVLSTSLPHDVDFKTMRKMEDFENDGTKIELWYNFEKKGNYQLPPLPVMVQNKRRNISFTPVTVMDDPAKQSPQLVVVFSNDTKISSIDEATSDPLFDYKVGEKLSLTIYVQYTSQLVQFAWDIPKDSIFTQLKTYDITEVKYREKNYTHDLIPVATFEWTGLKTGLFPMIKLKAVVSGYNGYRTELFLPECYINFTEAPVLKTATRDRIFNDAFQASYSELVSPVLNSVTEEDCIYLAKLYSEERNTILHFKTNHNNRVEFENSLGLPSTSQGDFSMGYLHICFAISVILLILLLIFIKKKSLLPILFTTAIFICSLVPLFNLLEKRADTYAICKGCSIHSVPEDKSEAVSEIGAGNRVHITEKAGRWVYIEFGETGGWGLKDNVILIK